VPDVPAVATAPRRRRAQVSPVRGCPPVPTITGPARLTAAAQGAKLTVHPPRYANLGGTP
jgi:hypothetical protein